MKIPGTFLPNKKLEGIVKKFLEEKPEQKHFSRQSNDMPSYATLENGDCLELGSSCLTNGKVSYATFWFTMEGKEHYINISESWEEAGIDGKVMKVEKNLIFKLKNIAVASSHEPDYDSNGWKLDMLHVTRQAYEELAKMID